MPYGMHWKRWILLEKKERRYRERNSEERIKYYQILREFIKNMALRVLYTLMRVGLMRYKHTYMLGQKKEKMSMEKDKESEEKDKV